MTHAEQDAFWLFNLKPLALRVRVMAARGELTEKHMTTTLRIAHLAGAHPISVSGATNCKIMPGESRDVHVWQGNGISIVELSAETAPAKDLLKHRAPDTAAVYIPKAEEAEWPAVPVVHTAAITNSGGSAHSIYLDPTPAADPPFGTDTCAPASDTSGSFD